MSDSMNAIDVAYETEINLESKSTEQLAAEVNVRYHQAEGLASMSAMMLADAGRRLIEIKARIPHGQFETWCADNLEFSKSKAEKMMKLAERVADENSLFSKTETFTDIGISRVWALLAAPEEVAAEVIEENDIESMTVRELKEEIARIKEEKREAETEKARVENNNLDLRKELTRVRGELSEAITETDFNLMKKAYEAEKDDLEKQVRDAQDALPELQNKLDKAKEDLKKAKQKPKDAEASKDEEIQKRLEVAAVELEEKYADDIKKAKEDGIATAEAQLNQFSEEINHLQGQVDKLEAEKAKLSNTSLMEFKVLCDQLQDIYGKIRTTYQGVEDEEIKRKMGNAFELLTEDWKL